MDITTVRALAREIRDEVYTAQEAHPRLRILQDLVGLVEGLDYNLHLALIDESRGSWEAAPLVRAGFCLGRLFMQTNRLHDSLHGRPSLRGPGIPELREQAGTWSDRSRACLDMLQRVNTPQIVAATS